MRHSLLSVASGIVTQVGLLLPPLRRIRDERDRLTAELDHAYCRLSSFSRVDQATQDLFLVLASHFSPRRAVGFRKIRVGRGTDGGYVLLDAFERVSSALSLGIAGECSWDLDIAVRGIEVYQFDHACEGPPLEHERFHFFNRNIATTANDVADDFCAALARLEGPQDRLILKMDIEGMEWDIFDTAAAEDLARFSQIVCEFHQFPRAIEEGWRLRAIRAMEKLKAIFEVVHIHANNCSGILPIANVPFPETLEVTFANRAFFKFEDALELFPTTLDRPNLQDVPDIFLGAFLFRR